MTPMFLLKPWFHAARPRTLPAAAVPVFLGSACASAENGFQMTPALIALVFALLVQITCNFANDYGDFAKGADNAQRRGPARAVASGWISPVAMKRAVAVVAAVSFLVGLTLVFYGGVWLIPVGVICLLACLAYTAGPFPLAYNGLGDVFVLVFFGFVAVLFSTFVQCGFFPFSAWIAGFSCGLLAVNILVVNNARDLETDAAAGKMTLVARFGRRFAHCEYAVNFALAIMAPVIFLPLYFFWKITLLIFGGAGAVSLCRKFFRAESGTDYNALLGKTAGFLLVYGGIFSLALVSQN